MRTHYSLILSKHSRTAELRFRVAAENLRPSCKIPGSPFGDGLFLVPNAPGSEKATVTYGPFDAPPDIDAISCFVRSPAQPEHLNVIHVDVSILDAQGIELSQSRMGLSHTETKAGTLHFEALGHPRIQLRFSVSFGTFVRESKNAGVEIRDVVGYKLNPLVQLVNRARSDKGTEWNFGGAPHCYAVEYYKLFKLLREQKFNLLEIGLDNASKSTGCPQDAPSLRVWRDFFPKATIYGYDINDFSFLQQTGGFTFRGNQASREDIKSFLSTFGQPEFALILDDGSHASSHQQISLANLFPRVKPGGMYIIEDLSWQPFAESVRTLEVLQKFCESGIIESPFLSEAEARYLEQTISQVEVYKPNDMEFAVIRKTA